MSIVDKIKNNLDKLYYVRFGSSRFFYKVIDKKSNTRKVKIIGMVRERNESLILKDTLDHLSKFVDGIVVYDDASTDNSVQIALDHPAVLKVLVKKRWQAKNREWTQTADRQALLKHSQEYHPEWVFYADADERFEGNIREYLLNAPKFVEGVRISLFDAYITKNDKKSYKKDTQLYNFRKMFGVERRDILMIWRNHKNIKYDRRYGREPSGVDEGGVVVRFYCQHYGKSLSIEHWEETCQYYADYLPRYREKWLSRMGKAIHVESDFGTKLYRWDEVKDKGVKI